MLPCLLMREMEIHVHSSLRQIEVCGILAGKSNVAIAIYPIENSLHSPTRFNMEPMELLAALMDMEGKSWEIQAIYHSHPNGPDHPSITDIREAYIPDILHIIWYYRRNSWNYKTYKIDPAGYHKEDIRILGKIIV